MKTRLKLICTASMAILGIVSLQAQKNEKKVQIKVIENGKVITDTSFYVNESVKTEDISRIPNMLNRDPKHTFRGHPGERSFEYSFRSEDMPGMDPEHDSVFFNNRFIQEGDSMARDMAKNFMNDSLPPFRWNQFPPMAMERGGFNGPAFMTGDCPCREQMQMKRHRGPHIEKEVFIDKNGPMSREFQEMNREDENIIIQQDGLGKKQIIIQDQEGNLKTIHKKIDKDTEIIIIKKDPKKIQPQKGEIRK